MFKKNKYKEFWKWFVKNEKYIYDTVAQKPNEIVQFIQNEIHKINPNLAFEIGTDLEDGLRDFIVSADGLYQLFPTVLKLEEFCPKQIKGWKILFFRPRRYRGNQSIGIEEINLSYDDIFFTYVEHHNHIDIDIYIKDYIEEDHRFVHIYFLLLDSLIGEYDAVTMIGNTSFHDITEINKASLYGFRELLVIIDEFKNKQKGAN